LQTWAALRSAAQIATSTKLALTAHPEGVKWARDIVLGPKLVGDPMPRGLDHIVHAVADLDHAADIYRALGFTVGAENQHPWGTTNRIVQLPGCFVELLAIARPYQIIPHAPHVF